MPRGRTPGRPRRSAPPRRRRSAVHNWSRLRLEIDAETRKRGPPAGWPISTPRQAAGDQETPQASATFIVPPNAAVRRSRERCRSRLAPEWCLPAARRREVLLSPEIHSCGMCWRNARDEDAEESDEAGERRIELTASGTLRPPGHVLHPCSLPVRRSHRRETQRSPPPRFAWRPAMMPHSWTVISREFSLVFGGAALQAGAKSIRRNRRGLGHATADVQLAKADRESQLLDLGRRSRPQARPAFRASPAAIAAGPPRASPHICFLPS